MMHMSTETERVVFWHRDMPPLAAEAVGEYVVEATSGRVPGTISHRDELWDRCYRELMSNVEERLSQEVARLGGHYAHVYDQGIDTRPVHAAGEAWLRGRFAYMLYRRPSEDANREGRSPEASSVTDAPRD